MTGASARLRAAFSGERLVLALVVAAGLALASAHLAGASPSGYYATSVRSMSESWHAWFYGALDPAATITVDKVPGWLQIQALFVRVLGFHGWVIELPQVLAEGVSIVALYVAVRRWRGVTSARVAAAVFVLTPIVTPTFAHSMEDGPLVCCLILAADRAHRAAVAGRPRSLIAAALWIAVGFQMKMTAAWVLLPAVLAAYLIYAPIRRRVRLLHAAIATAVCGVVSILWITVVALVSAGSRPYVDGTSNNNVFAMVFGYNGLERFGIHLHGSLPQLASLVHYPYVPGRGWGKLFSGHLAPQISWLIPLAAVALVVGWRTRRGDRAGYVLWGGAWLSYALALSAAAQLPHTAYVVVLAAPMAALVGPFLVDLVGMGWKPMAAVLVAQAGWTAWVWTVEPTFAAWLRWGAVGLAVIALIGLVLRLPRGLVAASLTAALLVGPATWTLSTLDPAYVGSDTDATAGPPGPPYPGTATPVQLAMFGAAGADFATPGPDLSGDAAEIWHRAKERQGTARYPLATVGWYLSQPFILATGEEVFPTGGYSRMVPQPTLAGLEGLVRSGYVRTVLLGVGALRADLWPGSANVDIVQWVRGSCTLLGIWSYPADAPRAQLGLFDCSHAG